MIKLIPPHGGYKNLEVYKTAVIISDGTAFFCQKWLRDLKLVSQMNGAARSGKQCIAEGSLNSGTSKKLELKLIGNARGSYEELLEDFLDFLRQRDLKLWEKDSPQAQAVRRLAYMSNRSYTTYKAYMGTAESGANCLICLLNQENYLLDRLLATLEHDFMEKGGFTERLYSARNAYRSNKPYTTYKTNKK